MGFKNVTNMIVTSVSENMSLFLHLRTWIVLAKADKL